MARIEEVTITSGSDTSSSAEFRGGRNNLYEAGSLVLSGTYTNTAFDIQAKIGDSWYNVYDAFGSQVSITVADGKHTLAADAFKDVQEIRIKGDSNEGADRTAYFVFIEVVD